MTELQKKKITVWILAIFSNISENSIINGYGSIACNLTSTLLWVFHLLWGGASSNRTLRKILREIKAKIMNFCKVGFFISFFVASSVDSDSLTHNGRNYYFNSCQCGEAVIKGYFFSLNTKCQHLQRYFSNFSCMFLDPKTSKKSFWK